MKSGESSPEHDAEVLEHCREKLAVLLPGGFIKTGKGRALAAPLHEEILAFMREKEAGVGAVAVAGGAL